MEFPLLSYPPKTGPCKSLSVNPSFGEIEGVRGVEARYLVRGRSKERDIFLGASSTVAQRVYRGDGHLYIHLYIYFGFEDADFRVRSFSPGAGGKVGGRCALGTLA